MLRGRVYTIRYISTDIRSLTYSMTEAATSTEPESSEPYTLPFPFPFALDSSANSSRTASIPCCKLSTDFE